MSPALLAATVQDSKAKRQERLKSRFRDRGGIFVPAEGNPLVQLLLERGVNGESPVKRRSPRKSTAARHTTPKSVRSAKVATKTPRTASKRARKSIVVSDANAADEDALPQPGIVPASTKKNKRSRSGTSKSKTTKSRGKRSGPHTKGVDGGGDVDAEPQLGAAGPSRPHTPVQQKSMADSDRLADAIDTATGHCPPESVSTPVKPSRLAPSPSSQQGARKTVKGKGKTASTRTTSTIKSPVVERRRRINGDARGNAVQSTAVDLGRKSPQPPSPGGGRVARRRPRRGDCDSSDHSDVPLPQKHAKIAPAGTRPKSGKRTDATRPPPARKKRAAPKAKADTKRAAATADDADGDKQTKRAATSAIVGTETGGASTATEATAGKEVPANSRKRGAEEGRGHEESPRGGEAVPDVVLPSAKRARVLQEKSAPRKRKESAKNVDDGNNGIIQTADNENENGPPTKKRRRVGPQTASRRRPGKENENGMEQSKPSRKPSKGATNKSPTGAHRKTSSKGKPPLRSGGTRARSRGLPPDVLRRLKVNEQKLEAPQDIDDDDPIDFLRS